MRLVVLSAVALTSCLDPVADGTLSILIGVDTLTPSTVASRRGDEVTVLGKNFTPGMQVFIGGLPATGVTVHDRARLSFVTPPHAPGWVELELISLDGQKKKLPRALRYFAQDVQFTPGRLAARFEEESHRLVAVTDLDADGLDDVVVTDRTSSAIAYMNPGAERGFRFQADSRWADLGTILGVADVDADGRADLLVIDAFLLNRPDGLERRPFTPVSTRTNGSGVRFTDLDADGFLEGVELRVMPGDNCAELQTWRFFPTPLNEVQYICNDLPSSYTTPVGALGDVDGDGRGDLAFVDTAGLLMVRFGPELIRGTQSSSPVVPSGRLVHDLAITDLTGDGRADVAITIDNVIEPLIVLPQTTPRTFPATLNIDGGCGGPINSLAQPSWSRLDLARPALTLQCSSGPFMTSTAHDPLALVPGGFSTGGRAMMGKLDRDARADLLWLTPTGIELAFGAQQPGSNDAPFIPDPVLPNSIADADERVLLARRGNFGGASRAVVVTTKNVIFLEPVHRSAQITHQRSMGLETTIVGAGTCDVEGDGDEDIVALLRVVDGRTIVATVIGLSDDEVVRTDGPVLTGVGTDFTEALFVGGALSAPGRCELALASGHSLLWLDPLHGWQEHRLELPKMFAVTLSDFDRDGLVDVAGTFVIDGRVELAMLANIGGTFTERRYDLNIVATGRNDMPVRIAAAPAARGAYDVWVLDESGLVSHVEVNPPLDPLTVTVRAGRLSTTSDGHILLTDVHLLLGDFDGNGVMDVYPSLPWLLAADAPPLLITARSGMLTRLPLPPRPSLVTPLDFDDDGLDDFVYLMPHAGLALFHNESR